jgi:hypothetical protein
VKKWKIKTKRETAREKTYMTIGEEKENTYIEEHIEQQQSQQQSLFRRKWRENI